MKTLVIVSHPDLLDSSSQQYFLNSVKSREYVTIHHLEGEYPDGKIDVKREQALLKDHDRFLFQFPFYWYSSPPLLKHWQDVVLEYGFAHGTENIALAGKEFGLILFIGVHEREYQAGGTELFSINELTKPFQAVAHKTGMTYLRPLSIFQFPYMEDEDKMKTLIQYLQMLTMENDQSLATREKWIVTELEETLKDVDEKSSETIRYCISLIQDNRTTIDGLKIVLDQMRSF